MFYLICMRSNNNISRAQTTPRWVGAIHWRLLPVVRSPDFPPARWHPKKQTRDAFLYSPVVASRAILRQNRETILFPLAFKLISTAPLSTNNFLSITIDFTIYLRAKTSEQLWSLVFANLLQHPRSSVSTHTNALRRPCNGIIQIAYNFFFARFYYRKTFVRSLILDCNIFTSFILLYWHNSFPLISLLIKPILQLLIENAMNDHNVVLPPL